MEKKAGWITPFKKQCFVTAGVCLNMSSHGIVMGFAAILLPQLERPGSAIPIDKDSGSWIGRWRRKVITRSEMCTGFSCNFLMS
ncbi:hypothetical protein MSG28_011358 [Choristoneura fumiferana]|uniref:Uncharacterized protein n=1 Tax=Choristoneura fumiferana TaxID=7141 RepID=A0ACC0JN22_CHOFU|nr:hypothetical protein MSG28_011358 [Choristoneura fumiferana]